MSTGVTFYKSVVSQRPPLLNYVPFAEQLLSSRFGQSDMDLAELTATDVTNFLQDRAQQLSPGRAKLLVTALRSFLRYLRHQGEISVTWRPACRQ